MITPRPSRPSSFRRALVALLCLAPLGAAGCASDKNIIGQSNEMHGQIEPAIVTDRDLAAYVQRIGDRVVASARDVHATGFLSDRVDKEDPSWMFNDTRFHLVNSETLNAFTTGGPHVYLYSELFEKSETEDEFAAVVAHEFGHIYGRHVHKGMNRQYSILGAAVLAGGAGYLLGGDQREELAAMLGGGAGAIAGTWGLGRTREDETEADRIGFLFYSRAGWDPNHFTDFFKRMIELGYETPEAQAAAASHPRLSSRVQDIEGRIGKLPPEAPRWRQANIANQRQFDALRERAKVVGASMPSDKSLDAAKLLLASFPSCVAPKAQPEQVEARQKVKALAEEAASEPASTPKRKKRNPS